MIKTLPDNFSVEERAARGRDFFLDGFNCCQSVLLAFEDILPVDALTLKTLGSGFGGGVGGVGGGWGWFRAIGVN